MNNFTHALSTLVVVTCTMWFIYAVIKSLILAYQWIACIPYL
jgi:hypothetical protein